MALLRGAAGRPGPKGATGETGPVGPPIDVSEIELAFVQEAAVELGKKKVRFTDRRLLILYGALVLSIIAFLTMFARAEERQRQQEHEFRVAITQVCTDLEESHARINGLLDQLAKSAANRTDRTPEEKAEAARVYAGLKLADLTCPAGG